MTNRGDVAAKDLGDNSGDAASEGDCDNPR